jgi:hypothetical protein
MAADHIHEALLAKDLFASGLHAFEPRLTGEVATVRHLTHPLYDPAFMHSSGDRHLPRWSRADWLSGPGPGGLGHPPQPADRSRQFRRRPGGRR